MKNKQIKNKKLKSLLPKIENRIRTTFGSKVLKIILFGSYARGDYNSESDVDIFVLINDNNLRKYRKDRVKIITEFLESNNLLLSIRIITADNFSTYKDVIPFYQNVMSQGITLYG
ncbi:nucleotidyltransferase domain protein [bacterium BMS3Abin03]|nr:nucleotidyltransferase domain protein [bacterium BMS3Abin03]